MTFIPASENYMLIISIFGGKCVSSLPYLAPMEALGGDKSLIQWKPRIRVICILLELRERVRDKNREKDEKRNKNIRGRVSEK